jgi:hypothetical protein
MTGTVRLVDRPDEAIAARLGEEITAVNGERGELSAAVYGWTRGGTCWIERLWERESERGADFYARHGFEVADYPAGHSYLLMRKRLAGRPCTERATRRSSWSTTPRLPAANHEQELVAVLGRRAGRGLVRARRELQEVAIERREPVGPIGEARV